MTRTRRPRLRRRFHRQRDDEHGCWPLPSRFLTSASAAVQALGGRGEAADVDALRHGAFHGVDTSSVPRSR